jgi:hypothetical protein
LTSRHYSMGADGGQYRGLVIFRAIGRGAAGFIPASTGIGPRN